MCYKHILVRDCQICHRQARTGEVGFDTRCGVRGCTAFTPSNPTQEYDPPGEYVADSKHRCEDCQAADFGSDFRSIRPKFSEAQQSTQFSSEPIKNTKSRTRQPLEERCDRCRITQHICKFSVPGTRCDACHNGEKNCWKDGKCLPSRTSAIERKAIEDKAVQKGLETREKNLSRLSADERKAKKAEQVQKMLETKKRNSAAKALTGLMTQVPQVSTVASVAGNTQASSTALSTNVQAQPPPRPRQFDNPFLSTVLNPPTPAPNTSQVPVQQLEQRTTEPEARSSTPRGLAGANILSGMLQNRPKRQNTAASNAGSGSGSKSNSPDSPSSSDPAPRGRPSKKRGRKH